MTKRKSQVIHARRRCAERFIPMNGTSYKNLAQQIQNQKAIFLEKQSCRVSLWAVQYEGRWTAVVYDKNTGQIVTFLPDSVLTDFQEKICARREG